MIEFWQLVVAMVAVSAAVAFGVLMGALSYFTRREEIDRAKIAQLEQKVEDLEAQVRTLMRLVQPIPNEVGVVP